MFDWYRTLKALVAIFQDLSNSQAIQNVDIPSRNLLKKFFSSQNHVLHRPCSMFVAQTTNKMSILQGNGVYILDTLMPENNSKLRCLAKQAMIEPKATDSASASTG